MLRDVAPREVPVCARCKGPAPEGWDIWGHTTCGACLARWNASERTTTGAVDAALKATHGKDGTRLEGELVTSEAYQKAVGEEFKRLARVWVASVAQNAATGQAGPLLKASGGAP